jgi:hypothetical protein
LFVRTVVAYAPQVGVYYGPAGSVQSPAGPTYPGERPTLIYTPGDQYVPGIVLHQNPPELEGGVLQVQGGSRSDGGFGTAPGAVGAGTMMNGQVPVVTATAVQVVGGYTMPISMSQAQHWQLMSGAPPNSEHVGVQSVQQPYTLQAQHWQLMSGPDLTSNTNNTAGTR